MYYCRLLKNLSTVCEGISSVVLTSKKEIIIVYGCNILVLTSQDKSALCGDARLIIDDIIYYHESCLHGTWSKQVEGD